MSTKLISHCGKTADNKTATNAVVRKEAAIEPVNAFR